jgi:hypothetical protein
MGLLRDFKLKKFISNSLGVLPLRACNLAFPKLFEMGEREQLNERKNNETATI